MLSVTLCGLVLAMPNHYLLIVLDSCRFDAFVAANPRTIQKLGPLERRWSYASWTSPSHFNLLMGLLPHASPRHVFASEYYKRDFAKYAERLGVDGVAFKDLLPSLWLPTFLRQRLGYRAHALVSLPVLNPATPLARDFDSFALMPTHNDMAAMLPRLRFDDDRPTFHLLNVGETHYPFALPSEDPSTWPRLSGLHGTLQRIDETSEDPSPFAPAQLAELRARQIETVRYLDGVFEQLFDLLPANTYVTVTADHGELFGEDGYVGHGPIQHDKVFEVPFLEGKVR
jgi:hypothetical protein